MSRKDNDKKKYFFKIDRNKVRIYLKGIKEKLNWKKRASRGLLYLLGLFFLSGVMLAVYFNILQNQVDYDFSQEPPQTQESLPGDEIDEDIEGFDELIIDKTDEIDSTEIKEDYTEQQQTITEKEVLEEEQPQLVEDRGRDEQQTVQDVVTEPVRPLMGTEQEDIQLLKPVSGDIVQEKGWYYHQVFEDWRFLTGINIKSPQGEVVMAADSGEVIAVREDNYKGIIVEINHEDVWKTSYGHLEEASVAVGERVAKGQEIGRIGQTGITVEPVLFFELRQKDDTVVNPGNFF